MRYALVVDSSRVVAIGPEKTMKYQLKLAAHLYPEKRFAIYFDRNYKISINDRGLS